MSSLKVYLKKGMPNYKEKRLVADIEKAIAEKMSLDSSFASTFRPARTFDELKALHTELCSTDVEFEEISSTEKEVETDNTEEKHKDFLKGMEDTIKKPEADSSDTLGSTGDPFNEANPIVREYVKDNGFKEEGSEKTQKTSFEEPVDFKSSFDMPSSEDEKGNNQNSSQKNNNQSVKKEQKDKPAPVNPSFDSMDNGKKKKSTKKFAKLIVEGTCLLAEKGCIWWTTKDITDDKLAEYQLNNEMDLNILLSLEDNQQKPVREWFRAKVRDANVLFKIEKEDRDDLTDSLYEVMLEKGIAPTPMQELIMNAIKTFVLDMGLKAYQLSSEINNVLGQLRSMSTPELSSNYVEPEQPREVNEAADVVNEAVDVSENADNYTDDLDDDTNTDINPATTDQLSIGN